MIVCMCIVTFRALHKTSVLVAAKHAANAVEQNCKVSSQPSKCVLYFGHKCQSKGQYVLSRVGTRPFLHLVRLKHEEVPNWV